MTRTRRGSLPSSPSAWSRAWWPGLLEFFHSAPTVDDVLFCLQKKIERRRKRKDPAVDPAPRLWIVTAGRPVKALDELGFAHDAAWPWGFTDARPDSSSSSSS